VCIDELQHDPPQIVLLSRKTFYILTMSEFLYFHCMNSTIEICSVAIPDISHLPR